MLRLILIPTLLCATISTPLLAFAQVEEMTFAKARVTAVVEERTEVIEATGVTRIVQTLEAEVIDGPDKGTTIQFVNDYVPLSEGDVFYIRHLTSPLEGVDVWSVADPYRLPVLTALAALFLVLLFMFGGVQGVRGLASLVGSVVLIIFVLAPGILGGHSPILVATGVAGVIIVAGSYLTHGVSRTTTAAVLGMLVTVTVTGGLALLAMSAARLSGYASDEAATLYFQTGGAIDIAGLLFGGIMIGLLGVLYDIAIGQAVAVDEIRSAGALSRHEVFRKGLRVGREHIGALVNTLAIAYVGASLPLFLLVLSGATGTIGFILNNEIFATEIVRILVGSIGLILAVPVTTWIAVRMLTPHSSALH